MKPSNDNARPNYSRRPFRESQLPKPGPRDIHAWEIDSRLDPASDEGQEIVGYG